MAEKKFLDLNGLSTLWNAIKAKIPNKYASSKTEGGAADKAVSIPFGQVDSTSTSTAFTATVDGITELRDGVCVYLQNGVVTSASGCTLDVNQLGAKPIYASNAAASGVAKVFASTYTMLFVYNSSRIDGGCWDMYYGYDSNSNTIGYQLRTNSLTLPMAQKVYRYRLLFTSADGTKWVGANTSSSTNATASRTPNQTKIDPFGKIVYYGSTTVINANASPGATVLWSQYVITLGYSFNNTGAALVLDTFKPVYIKCTPQSDGSAIIDSTTPYTQSLPSTADGKIYIFLGIVVTETTVEIVPEHPIYCYRNNSIQLWTGLQAEVDTKYTKPASGIPASDLASGVIPEKLLVIYTLSGIDNGATVACDKTYNEIAVALQLKKAIDAYAVYGNTVVGRFTSMTFDGTTIGFSLAYADGSSTLPNNITCMSVWHYSSGIMPLMVNRIIAGTNITPAANGIASPGYEKYFYALADHVHPMPTAADVGAIAAPSLPSDGNVLMYNQGEWEAVTLTAEDVEAIPTPGTKPSAGDVLTYNGTNRAWVAAAAPVTSVNGSTGAVTLTIPSVASDVGAIATPSNPSSGDVLTYNGSAWTATAAPVTSVNGKTGAVVLDADDVGAAEIFLVTVTGQGVAYEITDRTMAELSAAYAAGKVLQAVFPVTIGGITFTVCAPLAPLMVSGTPVYYMSQSTMVLDGHTYWVGFLQGSDNQADINVNSLTSDVDPQPLGTKNAGLSSQLSRADHVHAMPTATDVGALPSNTTYVSTVNGSSGAVTITAAGIGAIAAPSSPATGAFVVWDGTAWTAQTLATWQGGNY